MAARSPPSTRFRFKTKSKRSRKSKYERQTQSPPRSRSRSPGLGRRDDTIIHRRQQHRRSEYHETDRQASRSESPRRSRTASPDTAFRESLFDALADDEGAAYWEGVYGQPIHTYSRLRPGSSWDDDRESIVDADGKPVLERMTDEEYTSYVRARMWEKSHAYILEEREKKHKARATEQADINARQRQRKEMEERAIWDDRLHDVLGRRRGEGPRNKEAKTSWDRYTTAWEVLEVARKASANSDYIVEGLPERVPPKLRMPWPTITGRKTDIRQETVEAFYKQTMSVRSEPRSTHSSGTIGLLHTIKNERVRWHPDKIQQRYGALHVDDLSLRTVTAVFQILDRFWTTLKTQ